MAVKVNLGCPVCGAMHLNVRSSEKMGLLTTQTRAYCSCCLSVFDISATIEKARTATWTERPEVHRISKPLKQIAPSQLDFLDKIQAD